MAIYLELSEAEIDDIKLAGIFHDIGKVYVPEHILNKPAPLTVEEFELTKTHAVLGAKIFEPLTVPAIERIVRYHHERIDGTGYPEGLKGGDIPLGSRIIAVANALDAMVSHQPYRKARSLADAAAEIRRCSGTQFDPEVVDALVYFIEYPGAPPCRALLDY
jgi:HD-GYP domain-containing protein (c-di-GMP phosphodiesterase class II)